MSVHVPLRHPAENLIRYLIIRDLGRINGIQQAVDQVGEVIVLNPNQNGGAITDAQIQKYLVDWGFLSADPSYLGFLRQTIGTPPDGFNPVDRMHRPSMQYLRDQRIYDLFFPTPPIEEAWSILSDLHRRQIAEQIILARCINKEVIKKVNARHNLLLTEEGLQAFCHFFWNVNLLSFDQWGKYLYDRSVMYDDYMALLRAPPQQLLFKLRIEQQIESKEMIKRAQEIAFHNLEQVNLVPGVRADKVKAIGVLTKAINDCDASLSASDAALSGVLKQFEQFRTSHPQLPAPDINQLVPSKNYSGSGKQQEKDKDKVPS